MWNGSTHNRFDHSDESLKYWLSSSKTLVDAIRLRHDFIGKQILQASAAEVEDQLTAEVLNPPEKDSLARQDEPRLLRSIALMVVRTSPGFMVVPPFFFCAMKVLLRANFHSLPCSRASRMPNL
jgi:hypothetical protein